MNGRNGNENNRILRRPIHHGPFSRGAKKRKWENVPINCECFIPFPWTHRPTFQLGKVEITKANAFNHNLVISRRSNDLSPLVLPLIIDLNTELKHLCVWRLISNLSNGASDVSSSFVPILCFSEPDSALLLADCVLQLFCATSKLVLDGFN